MKRTLITAIATLLLMAFNGAAQANSEPEPEYLSGKDPVLNAKEWEASKLAYKWISRKEMPVMHDDGKIVFLFGSTLPSVVCSPLHVCDLELQPGETVMDIRLGDTMRWEATPSMSGSGANLTSHIIIKPHAVGLVTSLAIMTDRRVYHIQLKSRKQNWMPRIGFSYPNEIKKEWAAYYAKTKTIQERKVIPETRESVDDLDFDYEVTGSAKWKPLRVYNNGVKTIIQMPKVMNQTEAPALLALGEGEKEQLVNYRLHGDRYIVDQIFDSAILIAGVGKSQSKVTIKRKGAK